MLDFFSSIIEYIELGFELIGNFLSGVLGLLDMAQVAVALPVILQQFMPGVIGSSIVAVVSCGVIKFIFGR